MIRIAVTGGIACGKSHLAEYLNAHGIATCDADALAHVVMEHDDRVYDDIVKTFGVGVLRADGAIDRGKLGEIVFGDPRKRAALNRLVHPVVKRDLAIWLKEQACRGKRMVAVIVPLLFEAGMEKGWDAVVCVACEADVQLARLQKRGLTAEAGRLRVAAQMSLAEKARRSDYVIWNNGSIEQFEEQIDTVWKRIEETII